MHTRQPAAPARRLAPGRRPWTGLLAACLAALAPAAAEAIAPFQFEKPPGAPSPSWSRSVQAGVNLSTGNTAASGLNAEAGTAWLGPRFKLQAGGSLALARSRVTVAQERDGVAGLGPGETVEETETTRHAWSLRTRLDRFASARTSAYVAAGAGGDRPAGKRLVVSGQIGYGVDVLQGEPQALRLELGYDLSREAPVVGRVLEIHSARLFVGYRLKVDERLTLTSENELLTNLNPERASTPPAAPLHDTRVLSRLALEHRINGSLAICVRVTATFDAAPPVRPPPPGGTWEAGYAPLAQRLDTTTDLLLKASF